MKIEISKKYMNNNLISFVSFTNKNDFKVVFSSLGASIYAIYMKSKYGYKENIIMTPANDEDYFDTENYHGKTIGRTAGRISNESFSIDNSVYYLKSNRDNLVVLHGGEEKFSDIIYEYEIYEEDDKSYILFNGFSKEGNHGYPGDINFQIKYSLFENIDDLRVDYYATTNKKTILNLTNHAYFNLSGDFKRTILEHELLIKASRFVDIDEDLLPICIRNVNEVMDFRDGKRIGMDIENSMLQNHSYLGYDHPFIFDDQNNEIINASLLDPISLRQLDIYTTYPSIVVYTNNYPTNKPMIDKETIDSKYDAICLECQFVPNGINMNTDEDKAILEPNQQYHHMIRYSFKVKENKYYE